MLFYVDDPKTMFFRTNNFSIFPTSALAAFNTEKTNKTQIDLDGCYGEAAILNDNDFEQFKKNFRKDLQNASTKPSFDTIFVVALHFKLDDDNLVIVLEPDGCLHCILKEYCDLLKVPSTFISKNMLEDGIYNPEYSNPKIMERFIQVMNYS